MSSLATNAITDASGGNTATINSYTPTESNMAGRNRIINGDMRIDQRNAGASVTITDTASLTYTVDRWAAYGSVASKFSVQQNAAAVTPPVGYTNYLGATSLSAYSVGSSEQFQFAQAIEGFNVADLGWGTASAATVTLSFWVRSSLTGTFGGALRNTNATRSYPYSYTISVANTWEQKTITIAGDTSGTWLTTNGVGIRVEFGLGVGATLSNTAGAWATGNFVSATDAVSVVGTSGATFYITGVQLEAGSVATPFERRLYGQELALCQRYCYVIRAGSGFNPAPSSGWWDNATGNRSTFPFPTTMRATPSLIFSSFSDVQALQVNVNWNVITTIGLTSETSPFGAQIAATSTGGTAAHPSAVRVANNGFIGFTAEL